VAEAWDDALFPEPTASAVEDDSELERVARHLLGLDPDGSRIAAALRNTIDMLLNGQQTGRFRWEELFKTEKTHCGTLVEINLQREFGFHGGKDLDYEIAGADVDCKYSQDLWKWMIPPEAVGKLCLVVWASDEESRWCAGLVRTTESVLGGGANRDLKRTLSHEGRRHVRRLFWNAPLQENTLLHLPDADIKAIFAPRSGQQRLDELFRRAQRRRISRTVIATVAQQDDYMKRIRYNGGSRSRLQPEGIVIFGQFTSHQNAAAALNLPIPQAGESVSARLTRYKVERHGSAPRVVLDGSEWTLARAEDPPERAPMLPQT
jgi:hypothetical protein